MKISPNSLYIIYTIKEGGDWKVVQFEDIQENLSVYLAGRYFDRNTNKYIEFYCKQLVCKIGNTESIIDTFSEVSEAKEYHDLK